MVRHRVSWQELCISGDSIITTSQGKQTIKDMFDKQERQRLKYNSVKYPSVKCYDEVARKFTTTKVKEIFYTGKKEVFELVISASGKTKKIKATKDHKFLTKDGWKRLEEIKESDFMALNGQPLYRDKEWLKEQKEIFLNNKIGLQGMSKSLNINYNTLRKWLKIHNLQYTQKEISSTYEIWNKGVTGKESHNYGQSKNNEARQKISEKLSKPLGYSKGGFRKRVTTYWSAEFRKTPLLKKFNNCCNICETSTNLEIDHILPVTTNPELAFNEDNIQILCKDCHREKTRLENSSNRQTIKWGFVTHIKKLEIVDTYDLEVEHPSHNYVANGIVTHNSRRYVSGERVPFEFYVSEKLKENQKVQDLIKQSEDLYFEALEKGVKPQEARRIIPQCAYTQIWGAFMPKQLDNYFKLRLHKTAQWEIQQTSQAMQELIEKENTNGI
jgi:transposase-like protein